jgi:hypothetical protein
MGCPCKNKNKPVIKPQEDDGVRTENQTSENGSTEQSEKK